MSTWFHSRFALPFFTIVGVSNVAIYFWVQNQKKAEAKLYKEMKIKSKRS